jgi:hypothetical protein
MIEYLSCIFSFCQVYYILCRLISIFYFHVVVFKFHIFLNINFSFLWYKLKINYKYFEKWFSVTVYKNYVMHSKPFKIEMIYIHFFSICYIYICIYYMYTNELRFPNKLLPVFYFHVVVFKFHIFLNINFSFLWYINFITL